MPRLIEHLSNPNPMALLRANKQKLSFCCVQLDLVVQSIVTTRQSCRELKDFDTKSLELGK